MTSDDTYEVSLKELKGLQLLAPDPARADRVRMRCRAQLSRRQKRPPRTGVITPFVLGVLAPVVVGSFCLLYIAALVTTALRFLQ